MPPYLPHTHPALAVLHRTLTRLPLEKLAEQYLVGEVQLVADLLNRQRVVAQHHLGLLHQISTYPFHGCPTRGLLHAYRQILAADTELPDRKSVV